MTRSVRCDEVPAVLAAWDPDEDLDEDVAVHVGACARCRAVFDGRFVPAVAAPIALAAMTALSVEPPAVPLPAGPPALVSAAPSRRWSRRRLSAVAVVVLLTAASVALGARLHPAAAAPDPFPPQCPEEVAAVALPECPPG